MKIILKYILTNVKERKTRTIVMLLSIVLSTTLLFVSLAIGESYGSAQRKMAIGKAGSATVVVSKRSGEAIDIDEIPEINQIKSKVGMTEISGLFSENGSYENFDLIGGSIDKINEISPPNIKEGSSKEISKNQIILPDRFTDKYGTKVGDSMELKIEGVAYKFKVVAIASYDTIFLRSTRGFNALVPNSFISDIKNENGLYDKIYIQQNENVSIESLKTELVNRLGNDKYNVSDVYNDASVNAEVRQKSMPFYLISFFTLVMSIFIIYSSYKIITAERIPVIGTFRSIGATEKTVVNLLILESLIYGISGGIIGIPIGIFTLKLILRGLGQSLSQGIKIPIVVSTVSVIIPVILAVLVSVLGAYIPAKKASQLSVKDIILDNIEEKKTSNPKKMFFGLILFVLSIILPRVFTGNLLTISGGISLLTLIIATIIVTPIFLFIFSVVLEKLYFIVFGNIGGLAGRNLRGNRNTSQNVILLTISISSVIVISNVGNFVNTYISDVFKGSTMDGFSQADIDPSFLQEVENIDGIKNILPIYVLDNSATVNGITVRVEATDDISVYSDYFAISYNDSHKIFSEFNTGRTAILSADALKKLGLNIGENVKLNTNSGSSEYRIAGSFNSRANNTSIVIPSNLAKEDFGLTTYGFFGFQADNPDAVIIQIRDMYKGTNNWSRSVREFTADAKQTVGAFLSPLNKLTYFIILLAAVGIINNLIINFIQKRRSIAMYRSLGLSNEQSMKLTLIEGLSMGMIGAVIAIIISYLEITTVFIVAGPKISMVPEIEGTVFLTASFMGIIITIIGSIVPIIKTKSMIIVDIIKCE